MSKLGLYIPVGPNPIFLRLFMLQLSRQTYQPNHIALYENGCKSSCFEWACKDILPTFSGRITHTHVPEYVNEVKRYFIPLKQLYLHPGEIDFFLKCDSDDFYSDNHIEKMVEGLGNHDLFLNKNSSICLVRPHRGDFSYKESAVMHHNPMGCAPQAIFNRKFADKYLGALAYWADRPEVEQVTADDDLMAEMSKDMDVVIGDQPAHYTYVSHGSNHSSSNWQSTGGKIYL